MKDLKLKPEHSFLENKKYLDELIKAIDAGDFNEDLIDAVLRADYYVNKLLRNSDSDMFKSELEQMSLVFKAVLDTKYDSTVNRSQLKANEGYFKNKFYIDSLIDRAESYSLDYDDLPAIKEAYKYLSSIYEDSENSDFKKGIVKGIDLLKNSYKWLSSAKEKGKKYSKDYVKLYKRREFLINLSGYSICTLSVLLAGLYMAYRGGLL